MNLSRVVLRLYGCVYKILGLINIKVAYSLVVVSAGFCIVVSQFVSRGRPAFNSRFAKFVSRSSGSIKFVILFQDSDIGGSSSITARVEYSFGLQF